MTFKPFLFGIVVTAIIMALTFMRSAERHPIHSDRTCTDVYNATRDQCAEEYENKWYNGGAVSYLRHDHLKDIPICDRIATRASNACNHIGQSTALSSKGIER